MVDIFFDRRREKSYGWLIPSGLMLNKNREELNRIKDSIHKRFCLFGECPWNKNFECSPSSPFVSEVENLGFSTYEMQVYGNHAGDKGCLLPEKGVGYFVDQTQKFQIGMKSALERVIYRIVISTTVQS